MYVTYLRNNIHTYGTIFILTEQYSYLRNIPRRRTQASWSRSLTEQYSYLRNNTYLRNNPHTYGTYRDGGHRRRGREAVGWQGGSV